MLKKIGKRILHTLTFGWDIYAHARNIQAEAIMRHHGVKFDAQGRVINPYETTHKG